MFSKKYEPTKLKNVIGLKKEAAQIKKYIKSWKKGKALILSGSEGSGKNLLVKIISKKIKKELVVNPDAKNLSSLKQQSLVHTGKIILLDEPKRSSYVTKVLKNSTFPVIVIINDLYNPKFSNLRRKHKVIKFSKTRYDLVGKLMEKVCKENNIEYERSALFKLARMSNGDVRFALNMLQSIDKKIDDELIESIDGKPNEENVFNSLKIIFKTNDLENVDIATRNSEKTPSELLLWIEENIPEEYKKRKEISKAFDYISLSNIFKRRTIKRQAFSLQKYTFSLGIWGTALSKEKKYRGYTKYKPPNMKRLYKQGKDIKTTLVKIATKTHTTTKKALAYIPLAKENPDLFDLGKDEIKKLEKL